MSVKPSRAVLSGFMKKGERSAQPSKFYNRRYYLRHCAGYDQFSLSRIPTLDDRLRTALSFVHIGKGDAVLDAACGRGELVVHSAQKGARVVGVDFSVDALRLTRRLVSYLPPNKKKRVKLIRSDITTLPVGDSTFDAAYFLDIIEHLTQAEGRIAVREMHRVLKRNGTLIAHTDNWWFIRIFRYILHAIVRLLGGMHVIDDQSIEETGHVTFYTGRGLVRLCQNQGFRDVRLVLPVIENMKQFSVYFRTKYPGMDAYFLRVSQYLSKTPLYYFASPTIWVVAKK